MTVQFDRIVVRHVDAGACYDLAATECAVELRSHPRSDDEVGVGVEADDLHLFVTAGCRKRGDVRLHRAFAHTVRFGDLASNVIGEVERARRVSREQRLSLVFRVLRRDHQIGAHTFPHAVQPVVQVHGKQRASIERHSEHDDHNDKRRSAEWFATQIGQR